MSIYVAYRQCGQSVRELCDSLRARGPDGPDAIPTSLRNDIGRFKVWAKNAGAHRKETNSMSLDHRLREASDVKNIVVKLLNDLKAALQDGRSSVPAGSPGSNQSLAMSTTQISSQNTLDKTSSDVEPPGAETDKSEESDTDSEFEECDEFEECLLDINNTVTCLYNLSIAIANPAPRDRLEKCASIDVSFYHQNDIDHVSNKFPVAEDYLVNRLGKANSKRRQLLLYYERHHKRVAGHSHMQAQADEQHHELQNFDDLYFESLADTANQTVTTISTFMPVEGSMAIGQEVNKTAPYVNVGLDDEPDFDTRSVTSYASSIGNADRLRVPPPPNEESAFEGIPFECPYCFSLVKVEGQQSWKRHVFKDLRPYVCTFPTCQRSEHLFESRHEWFEHEKTFHRREWFCSACHKIFTTDTPFREHLVQAHGRFHTEKLQTLIDQAERATESKQRCCLCEQDDLSPHLLQRHIGRHMQQLSLFVVPGSAEDEDSDRSSESDDHDIDEEGSEAEDEQAEDGRLTEKDLPAESKELHRALQQAAIRGHVLDTRLLLDHGADIEAKDKDNQTALQLAAETGHEPVVRLLLDRGADIESKGSEVGTSLHLASKNGHEPVVRLLLDRGADIESKDSELRTSLHLAAENGHEPVIRLLLDRGADVGASTPSGQTASDRAAMNGHHDIVSILRSHESLKR